MSGKDDLIKDRYRKMEIVGEGGYGMVIKCLDVLTNELVAIKVCKFNKEEGVSSTILREVSILMMVHHPNVISLKDYIQSYGEKSNVAYLVFPFIKEDLAKHLRRVKVLK